MAGKYIVGIDVGATNIKAGLIKNHRIISRIILPTRDFSSQRQLINGLVYAIRDCLLKGASLKRQRILGIGLGLPGLINFKKGIVHYLPNIKGWKNVPLRKIIQKRTGLPVFIDNDANLMSLAEARLGAAKGKNNVVGITLGTGVGAGIILNGKLYRGANFAAGEIGHLPINEEGPKCSCGGAACLERYIGNRYIEGELRKIFKKNISLEKSSELAARGNLKATKIWETVAGHLGIALSGVVNLLNPEVIVIGGGVSAAGGIIFDNVRRIIRERAMLPQSMAVKIVRARLGNDAGMMGAGLLVEEELGREPG